MRAIKSLPTAGMTNFDGLWQIDAALGSASRSDRSPRCGLVPALGHRPDAGAEHLSGLRAVVQAEGRDAGDEGRRVVRVRQPEGADDLRRPHR